MSFYKELVPFVEYIHSIRKLKNYFSFDMVFSNKWSIPKSLIDDGQIIGFDSEDQNMKGISFVVPITEKDISFTLSKIAKIIKLNKEKELKERLFKQTIEQLKQTFEKTDLDKLKNLYFDFDNGEESLEIEDNEENPKLEIYEQDGSDTESYEDGGE
jgi:hypothetical protein